ncbi:hypothetical protein FLAG1_08214 [Fusarium langsethiae]|uniref:Uncharacterized protein n=1 Tax=Fusarium langsethiae TaxID=179993 RepID=A0A0N0DCZ6_FUSLA|nr:hypothetical protein FLAG1_08214 [Fusarium langsethiae]GKU07115.1 unnamed protein product [Fusarium langsethiae]
MSQTISWCSIESPVPGLLTSQGNEVTYYSQTCVEIVEIVPFEKTDMVIRPRRDADTVARPRKPLKKVMSQISPLSTQWLIFREKIRAASPEEQRQFFQLCAAFAPEHGKRTDEEWRDFIGRLPLTVTYPPSPVLLHLSFEALRASCAGSHPPSDPRLLQRSANDNLAELRKLLGATEHISCNRLALEDRIVCAVPIGFVEEVYKSLPIALINDLPFETVSRALNVIDNMELFSQEDSNSFRNWMASEEGKRHYLKAKDSLCQLLTGEEFELSLTTLRCYELVLGDDSWWGDGDNDDSRPVDETWPVGETWIASFTAHQGGSVQRPRPNLWQIVGSSFKLAYSKIYPSTALRWLDTVLDERSSSDGLVQTFWERRMAEINSALLQEAPYDTLRSQAMQRQASQRGYC